LLKQKFYYRLRNLTQPSESGLGGTGGGPSNSITPRYQLADYRYGREEMLAMFGNIKPIVPEGLDSFQMLFAEKPLPPLALIQMTEDETVNEIACVSYVFCSDLHYICRGCGNEV
jgi:hypothetical protein